MDDLPSRRPRHGRARLGMLAVCSVLVACVPAGVSADSISDAQQQISQAQSSIAAHQGQLNQHQQQQATTQNVVGSLQQQLAQYGTQEGQLRALVDQLAKQVTDQQAKVVEAQQELDRITADMATAQAHLDEARGRLGADRSRLADQVKRIYETPVTSTINAMLSSDTFDELYQKYVSERQIAQTEQLLVQQVDAEAAQVQAAVQQIAQDQKRQAVVVAGQTAERGRLEAAKAAQEQAQARLDQVIAQDQVALAQNEQAQQEVAAEVAHDQQALAGDQSALAQAKAAEAAAVAAAQAAAAAAKQRGNGGGLGGYGGTGQFAWPEPPIYLSQGFGCTAYWAEPPPPAGYSCASGHFHTGLDIADPYGTWIHAADAGVVHLYVSAYGYGIHVIIAHGNGFSTIYGHMSGFAVADGAFVQRGQVIGYEGSTGNSSGPHLHFEIDRGATPVNPLAYLP